MKNKHLPTSYAFLQCFLPKELREDFQITKITYTEEKMSLRVEELKPPPQNIELKKGEKIISKGFCKPIELRDFPIRDRETWINVYRRKWKIPEREGVITRELDLHYPGMKTTKGFADFLKEVDRKITEEYRAGRGDPNVTREEAIQMVQGNFKRF